MTDLTSGYIGLLKTACEKAGRERIALVRLKNEHDHIEVLKLKNLIDLITRLHRKLEVLLEQHIAGETVFLHQRAVEDFIVFIQRFGVDALNEAYHPELRVDTKRMARTAIDEKTLHMLNHQPVDGLLESLDKLIHATVRISA